MWPARTAILLATLAASTTGPALAQGQGHHHHHGHHHGGFGPYAPSYAYPYASPTVVGLPFMPFVLWSPLAMLPAPAPWPGPMIPAPPGGDMPFPLPTKQMPRPSRVDPAKAEKLVKLGDNLLRAGIFGRAKERYRQAARADFSSAIPRMRLAVLAMVTGRYSEAADGFREAQAADPRWLDHPRDIQALFGDPSDFDARLAKLETHLQAHPEDRDAWLLLGITRLLTGNADLAADIFLRISREPPDPTLSAFLDAARRLHR